MRRIAIVTAALIAVLAAPAQASFPGANGRIAYLLPDADGFSHIWSANPDLSDARQLTAGAFSTWDEAWAADGRALVYSTDRYATAPPPDPGFRVDIVVKDLDTDTERLLTHGGINEQPSLSPDGTRVLFASTDPTTGEGGLFTINATDGSERRKLMDTPAGAEVLQWPRYSPNGSTIAFAGMRHPQEPRPGHSSDLSGATGAIYTVNADGTNLRRITAWGTISDSQVDWSPDGTRLVFETNWRAPGTGPDLWVINADGSRLRNLTNDPNLTPSMPFRASFDPTWAPDGSLIMFNCAPGALSLWDLCTIRPDGTGRSTVAATEGDEDTPAWQPIPVGSLR